MVTDPAFIWQHHRAPRRPPAPPTPTQADREHGAEPSPSRDPERHRGGAEGDHERTAGPPPPVGGRRAGGEPPTAPVPEGMMLVPLDAWQKVLLQLGNLHEAGQQLAEARERAAKAETQVEFLRERVRELKARVEASERAAAAGEPHGSTTGPVVDLREVERASDRPARAVSAEPLWSVAARRLVISGRSAWRRRTGR